MMARKTKNPIDASHLLKSSSGTLAQIAAKTNSLTLLADIVRQTCPDLPAEVWHIGNFRQNCIIIEVISSIWGQRLQFERMKICQQLAQATNNDFNQIEIKVSPYRNKQAPINQQTPEAKTQFISSKTAKQLNEVAENAPESLKRKLQQLARLAKK
ncbi:DciA family protein [Thalassotalea sp. G2M2-11]|uniref:DUF721 domain-containing protein n=1 Tax=Thalassotalea sp. G2M2-11 TaxID=2787627 RepID=UPI001F49E3E9|nr:DciA family protein [Thalassotalea sp. G2M2-11]